MGMVTDKLNTDMARLTEREEQIEWLVKLESEMQLISGQICDAQRRVNDVIQKTYNRRCKLELQRTDNEHYLANVGR